MKYNINDLVGYKTEMFTWKATVLDINHKEQLYLIQYQDFTGMYKTWIHEKYIIDYDKKS